MSPDIAKCLLGRGIKINSPPKLKTTGLESTVDSKIESQYSWKNSKMFPKIACPVNTYLPNTNLSVTVKVFLQM
jgi:hypothetical protein